MMKNWFYCLYLIGIALSLIGNLHRIGTTGESDSINLEDLYASALQDYVSQVENAEFEQHFGEDYVIIPGYWNQEIGEVKDICTGGYTTTALLKSGEIFVWGMGVNSTQGERIIFPEDNVHITQITCGDYHTMALTDEGEVWTWGFRSKDALGHGDTNSDEAEVNNNSPRKVAGLLAKKKVIAIAGGYEHSIAVTNNGRVYGWGNSKLGQTGVSKGEVVPTPEQIKSPKVRSQWIVDACCGGDYTALLSNKGEIFIFGSATFGKLGDGLASDSTAEPQLVQWFKDNNIKIKSMACGGDHLLVLSDKGDVYGWGWNEHHQLTGEQTSDKTTPEQITVDSKHTIKQLFASRYAHSFAITDDQQVLTWGLNDDYQLGTGDRHNRNSCTPLEGLSGSSIVKMAGGFKHSVALTSDGKMIGFGNNVFLQLGSSKDDSNKDDKENHNHPQQ